MKKRTVALLMACMIMVGAAAGGTIAWLTAQSATVVNTFTIGEVEITLTETDALDQGGGQFTKSFKVSPGEDITKDPKVTVLAGSEACYLFVRIQESDQFTDLKTASKLNYAIAAGWNSVDGHDGYYYRKVDAIAEDAPAAEFPVLLNNLVEVGDDIVNADVDGETVTLTFSAAAIQSENMTGADEDAKVATAFANLPGGFTA